MQNSSSTINPTLILQIEYVALANLKPLGREIRSHSKRQLKKIQKSLCKYGCVLPILITQDGRIVDGAAIVYAVKKLKWETIPCVRIEDLPEEHLRILRIGLNRLCEEAQWNLPELKLEFTEFFEFDQQFDIDLTGFEMGEIDVLMMESEEEEELPLPPIPSNECIVARFGDCFVLGEHRVKCADARDADNYTELMQGEQAQQILTDPPFNVAIQGHVSGNGRVKHSEFAMASGELSDAEYIEFLHTICHAMKTVSSTSALHYIFQDWRHMHHLLNATQDVYSSLLNLCIWVKSNGGLGSFYRSRHEMIFIFKINNSSHINNVELGRMGRYRTNVWEYAGCSSFGPERDAMLAMHPTVKPLQLIVDAILDASHHGDIVLDPFLGSGTTILACEKTGRRGYGMEIDPKYIDVTVRRWQEHTGQEAIHEPSGLTFNALAQQRKEETDAQS